MPKEASDARLDSDEYETDSQEGSRRDPVRRTFAALPPLRAILPMHDLIPLSQVAVGRRGEIGAVMGLPDSVQRLEELGMRVGVSVEMIQTGSPCIIKLADQRLCFRGDELFSVLVRTEDGP